MLSFSFGCATVFPDSSSNLVASYFLSRFNTLTALNMAVLFCAVSISLILISVTLSLSSVTFYVM